MPLPLLRPPAPTTKPRQGSKHPVHPSHIPKPPAPPYSQFLLPARLQNYSSSSAPLPPSLLNLRDSCFCSIWWECGLARHLRFPKPTIARFALRAASPPYAPLHCALALRRLPGPLAGSGCALTSPEVSLHLPLPSLPSYLRWPLCPPFRRPRQTRTGAPESSLASSASTARSSAIAIRHAPIASR